MVSRNELLVYLKALLKPENFSDYCPNGLQVEGAEQINHIVSGVTACQALLDEAVQRKADTVLVHHGYFWKGEDSRVISMKKQRLATLLVNDLNLLAYHLPLDAHAVYGNNVQLAAKLDLKVTGDMHLAYGEGVGLIGELSQPMSAEAFSHLMTTVLGRKPLHIGDPAKQIKTIAWCTGGAQSSIAEAAHCDVDAYLTGEVSENTFHQAKELGLAFFSAGHHATERYGVQALGKHLAEKFNITHEFVDIDNPV